MTDHPWSFVCENDDDVYSGDFPDESRVENDGDHYVVLQEEAVTAQRLAVSRNAVDYYKGRADIGSFDPVKKMTNEKMFKVSNLLDWISGDPITIVEAMRRGRVRARVSAAMGLGKSTLLPMYIADKMEHRVLYVSLDANALYQCDKYIRRIGKGAMRANWKTRVESWVCCMTYYDFCANAGMSKRADLFKHFETIIFDEAFVAMPAVRAAMKAFAVLALPGTNLLLCSANIRDDSVGADMGSVSQGNVKYVSETVLPEQAMAGGKLITNYLVDRTMIVLPSDERVHDMAEYYLKNGIDVRTLDSASRDDEVMSMEDWLHGDSSTPRVLVAHARYAIMYNFPVSFSIIWPLLSKTKVVDNKIFDEEVPMPRSLVSQAVARTGRGIVPGSGALVMGSTFAEEGVMTLSEKVEEFVLLCASYITPLRVPEWEGVYAMFPEGLSPAVAQLIRKVNMPAEVAVRFLAKDGKFAKKYVKGLMKYAQTDHYVYASDHNLPSSYETWVEEELFGAEKNGPVISVPIHAVGELKVILHAIVAVSDGNISFERWSMPSRISCYSDPESEGESTPIMQRRRLRRVRSFDKPVVQDVTPPKLGWSYTADKFNDDIGGRGTRSGVVINAGRMRDAMNSLFRSVDDFDQPSSGLAIMDTPNGSVSHVDLPAGEIESPGGTVICEFSGKLCQLLNAGDLLDIDSIVELVSRFRTFGNRIVISRIFDCFGSAWTSVLKTFHNTIVVGAIIARGLHSFAYDMIGKLNARFGFEVTTAVKNSNVFKITFMNVFKRNPTYSEVITAIRRGKFDGIAQSDAFVSRIYELKEWIDMALLTAEQNGVYLPFLVTKAQRVLPIHARTNIGNVADGTMVTQSARSYSRFVGDKTWRRRNERDKFDNAFDYDF